MIKGWVDGTSGNLLFPLSAVFFCDELGVCESEVVCMSSAVYGFFSALVDPILLSLTFGCLLPEPGVLGGLSLFCCPLPLALPRPKEKDMVWVSSRSSSFSGQNALNLLSRLNSSLADGPQEILVLRQDRADLPQTGVLLLLLLLLPGHLELRGCRGLDTLKV